MLVSSKCWLRICFAFSSVLLRISSYLSQRNGCQKLLCKRNIRKTFAVLQYYGLVLTWFYSLFVLIKPVGFDLGNAHWNVVCCGKKSGFALALKIWRSFCMHAVLLRHQCISVNLMYLSYIGSFKLLSLELKHNT